MDLRRKHATKTADLGLGMAMTSQPSTSLRVRFAKAMGITVLDDCAVDFSIHPTPGYGNLVPLPPIDANTVREAWKTLKPEERVLFLKLLVNRIKPEFGLIAPEHMAELVLHTEPTTLAELICEVRGVK